MTMHIPPQKLRKVVVLTRSERRAANTDTWVKQHLSEVRDAETRKRARLKALREARDAALQQAILRHR
jgi:Arc/MetJ-type ribon-helix-helix transcriptional regulator